MTFVHPRYPDVGQELTFPDGFLWGSATAAFQVEGALRTGGRTASIWDTFSYAPGNILDGDDPGVSADHYARMPGDVALMKDLNLNAYRFSVSWSRVLTNGVTKNQRGFDFYSRLVDELLEADILPWLTLYHWDLPQEFEDAGGWANRETAYRFRDYAAVMHEALGDRVKVWTTLNEPWCSAFLGYAGGEHAPGRQEPRTAFQAVHHLLLAHGLAVKEMRSRDSNGTYGITLNFTYAEPHDPKNAEDVDAVRRIDGLHNRLFLDPILRGKYPEDIVADSQDLGWTNVIEERDLQTISQPLDALGVNFYNGLEVAGPGQDLPGNPAPRRVDKTLRSPFVTAENVVFVSRDLPRTEMEWEIQPWGLSDLLNRLNREYEVPALYVTENGAAFDDQITEDGRVHDPDRTEYVDAHLRAIHAAIDEGVDVRGYFVWSLLDNFEWAFGYSKRFGIVYTDYETQERIPKDSAHWYADVARRNRIPALTSNS